MKLVSFLFLLSIFSFAKAQDFWTKAYSTEFNNSMIEFLEARDQELLVELDSIKGTTKKSSPATEEDLLIFKRSKILSKTIPLDYNDQVKFYIDKYISKNYRPYMNRLLGLTKHYFPIYEPILKEVGIPEEAKYLSVVESSLDPHCVSTSGAVGPWQFMYITAKDYKLEMSSYYDERKDAYSSSYAVSQYIAEAYDQFGDWLIALASYNCGRGCVKRAIERSGLDNPTFWELSPYLPQETRNYIPKYIAMTYVLSDPSFYDIVADDTDLNLEHQVLLIDKNINLHNVAQAIGLSYDNLKKYNPAYKKDLVNGSPTKPRRLLLPKTDAINDSLLYLALHENTPLVKPSFEDRDDNLLANNTRSYKAKKGETLVSISRKFDVSVQNLKAWNDLSTKSHIAGKTLIVSKPVNEGLAKNVKAASTKTKKPSVIVYTVKNGDSLDKIASKYKGVTVSKLKADNGLKNSLIKPGMKLKINKG